MAATPAGDFILGIDLGSNSLGWAMIGLENGKPSMLIRAGVGTSWESENREL